MPTVDFATFNKKIDANELKGIFRSGWQTDYPSIENFLTPLYAKGAWPPGSNWRPVRQPGVRRSCDRGGRGAEPGRGQQPVPAGRGLAGRGLPDAPLWYYKTTSAWSDKVTDVKVNAFGVLDFAAIKVK